MQDKVITREVDWLFWVETPDLWGCMAGKVVYQEATKEIQPGPPGCHQGNPGQPGISSGHEGNPRQAQMQPLVISPAAPRAVGEVATETLRTVELRKLNRVSTAEPGFYSNWFW
eukprot:s614_g23.t1